MQTIDLQRTIDEAPFGRFHWQLLLWCAVAIIFDGYDLSIMGVAMDSITQEMGITKTTAGFMASSALFGMMFGNVLLAGLANRLGRRIVICGCIATFSLFTVFAGFAKDPITFGILRFIAGLGIGGVMPNVIAQMTDFSPLRRRSLLITVMFSGYSVGSLLAVQMGKMLIGPYGWPSVFFAAVVPTVLLPFIWKQMPESFNYLVPKGKNESIRRIISQASPGTPLATGQKFSFPVATNAKGESSGAFSGLFQEGRGLSTILFWITCFMCLYMVYGISNWLKLLMIDAGYSKDLALDFLFALNVGAFVGAIGTGWLADRLNIKYMLVVMFAMAAVLITSFGHQLPIWALFAAMAIVGACTIGAQTLSCAYCSQFYPSSCRTTGVGLMLSMGRAGAILAPILLGKVLDMKLPVETNFMALGVPAAVAAVSMLLIQHSRSDLVKHKNDPNYKPAASTGH